MQFGRFFIVSLIGLVFDVSVSWGLFRLFGLPLWSAAGIGFLSAAGLNYVLHEVWTFKENSRNVSTRRALRYIALVLVVLSLRVGVVGALEFLIAEPQYAFRIFLVGVAVSFLANYTASNLLLFNKEKQ
ncbi:MAG: GtrA family protein [Hyphomonadaceae bacterium]|nr:GtrA family protein [Hyphomonadaceae bacterium]